MVGRRGRFGQVVVDTMTAQVALGDVMLAFNGYAVLR